MNNNYRNTPDRQRGFSLIELMIVVAIIAIVAAIALPSYQRYVIKTKRSIGQSALLQVADRQQQFFMDNKRFALNATALGFAANPYIVDDKGNSTVAADGGAIYSISLSNVTALTWTATATPLHQQLSRDTYCGSLSITHTGIKSETGSSDDCW
jgi:type IV pilus assembly protein PilE